MRIAVLTLTRDRLPYSKVCFPSLRENAGCEYDHYVLDQASTDGTAEWLLEDDTLDVTVLEENVGICRGLNYLLAETVDPADYDVIVRWDNDCLVTQPDTLSTVCEVADEYRLILAPRVLGLKNPPASLGSLSAGEHRVDLTGILGGIFMVIPADLLGEGGYRYDERMPPWQGDEAICQWYWRQGGSCGYLDGYSVEHYLTTSGQEQDDPAYWARKMSEMAA